MESPEGGLDHLQLRGGLATQGDFRPLFFLVFFIFL
jgi:hypothetical protein